jgi:hypothetical protein
VNAFQTMGVVSFGWLLFAPRESKTGATTRASLEPLRRGDGPGFPANLTDSEPK